jgi:hypothetical protein
MINRTNNKASTKPKKKQWVTFHRIKLNSRLFLSYQKGNSFDCLSCRCLNQVIERLDLKNHVILDYNLEEAPPLSSLFHRSRQGLYPIFVMTLLSLTQVAMKGKGLRVIRENKQVGKA